MIWFTTLGQIQVEEQVLRLGRRGPRGHPLSKALGPTHRPYSRRLQRAMTDFGAEESFQRAAQRLQEHDGIAISPEAIRHSRPSGMAKPWPRRSPRPARPPVRW